MYVCKYDDEDDGEATKEQRAKGDLTDSVCCISFVALCNTLGSHTGLIGFAFDVSKADDAGRMIHRGCKEAEGWRTRWAQGCVCVCGRCCEWGYLT